MVCDHHRGQHPSEPLNSHEERNLVMRHEPSGSCPPVQQACRERYPTCPQVKPRSDFSTTPTGASFYCRDCQRAVSRLASRRRAAAIRPLIAAHPEEWTGLLGLVRATHQVGTNRVTGGGRRA